MSNEMLNPLNAITGILHLIKSHDLPGKTQIYLDKIETASKQLLVMINDVLDVSGIEDGIVKLADSEFSFRNMADNVMKNVVGDAEKKKQKINCIVDRSIPETLIGDEKRLAQVIENVFANAIKFTPENGDIVFVALVLDEDDSAVTLQIEVADTGIGISEEHNESLFDVFEQIDGGLNRKHAGIGIGLPLSKRIIEMMGGSIWCESKLGKGAKFYFTSKMRKAK
jgi:signal transduction histidine kinase